MKRMGYRRVSSNGQARNGNSLQDQLERLLAAGVAAENIYTDVYTGTKVERPALSRLMENLEPGDELVVCKLDRFARTAAEGSMLVRDLVERGVRVNILNMGIADNTPMGKLMVTMLLAFAEFERDQIVERTQAGKAIARQKPDFREGRPAAQVSPEALQTARAEQQAGRITAAKAAEMLGISCATYYRLVACNGQ